MAVFVRNRGFSQVLPPGYQKLQYIESTGTQYIDTGFKPSDATGIYILAQYTEVTLWSSIFGARNGLDIDQYVLWPSGAGSFRYDYGNLSTLNIPAPVTSKQEYVFDGPHAQIGVNSAAYPSTQKFSCNYNLYLLTLNNAGNPEICCKARIFNCKIYESGSLIRNFIPCVSNTGDIGLYDTVFGMFYGNAGTGVFIAGYETSA